MYFHGLSSVSEGEGMYLSLSNVWMSYGFCCIGDSHDSLAGCLWSEANFPRQIDLCQTWWAGKKEKFCFFSFLLFLSSVYLDTILQAYLWRVQHNYFMPFCILWVILLVPWPSVPRKFNESLMRNNSEIPIPFKQAPMLLLMLIIPIRSQTNL